MYKLTSAPTAFQLSATMAAAFASGCACTQILISNRSPVGPRVRMPSRPRSQPACARSCCALETS